MKVCSYCDGKGLLSKKWSFEPLLFQSPAFVANQFPDGGYTTFTIEDGDTVGAIIHFARNGGRWVSLPKSPFGGLSIAESVNDADILELVNQVSIEAEGLPIEIHLPFAGYPNTKSLQFRNHLLDAGFAVSYQDVHQLIEITGGELTERMHTSQIRRLAKCRHACFEFSEENASMLEEVYGFIQKCRLQQAIPLNISLEHLKDSDRYLPGTYRLFSLRDGDKLIAACITTHVSEEVLYYFLPAASQVYNKSSPMVMLIYQLYQWASSQNYTLLDLGKSSMEGKRQEGLIGFKEKMGADSRRSHCFQFL